MSFVLIKFKIKDEKITKYNIKFLIILFYRNKNNYFIKTF